MPLQTGTHTIADLAENTFATTTVQEYGMDALNEVIQTDLAVHNARTDEMLREIADLSDERSTVYGTSGNGFRAVQKDEFTRAPTQKYPVGGKVEFPLDGYEVAVGWTAEYLRRATVQDMAKATIGAKQAHVIQIQYDIKNALFGPVNYTWTDRLVDSNALAVKRLVNGDSAAIPNGPNGETFDASTHTHYDAIDFAAASGAARIAFVQGLFSDVIEHGHGSDVRLYINRAQETSVRAMTPNFTPLPPPNIEYRVTDTPAQRLDITKADNRMIGYFDGFPVWTKTWVPAGYFFVFSAGSPQKTLRYRQSRVAGERGLFLAGEIITHPLQARYMNFFHGFGVYNRTNGCIGYLTTGTYAAPTLTL